MALSTLPLNSRDSFFRDPFFEDCRKMMEKQFQETMKFFESTSNSHSDLGNSTFGNSTLGNIGNNRSVTNSSSRTSTLNSGNNTMNGGGTMVPFNSNNNSFNGNSNFNTMMKFENNWEPFKEMQMMSNGFPSEMKYDDDKFQVMLEVQQFGPKEVEVKTVDNFLVVEGKHEEKKDGDANKSFVSRQFSRKYQLPDDVRPESVECNLSSDGVLVITAPRVKTSLPAITEKRIPIQNSSISNNMGSNIGSTSTMTSSRMEERRKFPAPLSSSLKSTSKYGGFPKEHNINIQMAAA